MTIRSPSAGVGNVGRSGIVRRAMVLRSDDLGRRVVSGATYTFLGVFLRTVLTIGSMAVLARLLTPADFGYIAMATVVTEFAALFANFGFSSVLVQRRRIGRLHLDTVFWASAMLGVVLALVVFALSFLAGRLYGDSLSGELLRLLCLAFIFGELSAVHGVILARLMQFRTVFWIEMGAIATRVVVAVVLAWQGFGVWSLVAGAISGSLAQLLFSILLVPYVPRFRFNFSYIASTFRTSSSYFGGGVLFYIDSNIDLFLIGRAFGATSLGLYQNARSLTDEVRSRIAIPLQRVLFPAFSAMQSEQGRLQQSVIRSGRLISALIFPAAIGISAVAEELIPLLYGSQWLAMIPVVEILGLSAALRGSLTIAIPIFHSSNRVGLALKYNAIGSILMVIAVLITVSIDIEAVAIAIVLSSLYSFVTLRVGLRLIGLGAMAMVKMLGAPALASTVMWVGIEALRSASVQWISSSALLLLAHIMVGALIYCISLLCISPMYVSDLRALLGKLRKND